MRRTIFSRTDVHLTTHATRASTPRRDDVHMRINRVLRQIGQRDKIPGEKLIANVREKEQ